MQSDTSIAASFRNGEQFKGSQLAFFDSRSARLDLLQGGESRPIEARSGDIPAITVPTPDDGLVILVHQTAPSTLTYKTWDKFRKFAEHKDFAGIRARHLDRGLPEADFAETYTRFVKTLVAVGGGAGSDAGTGLETEFVALDNPYTDDLSNGMTVLLLYQGHPRGDAQVEVFERDETGAVAVTLLRTNEQGVVRVPVRSGRTYLLDAVVLRPAPDDSAPVWETLWAALTFAVP